MTIKETDKTYVANTYNRFNLLLDHGHGSTVYDEQGKAYIDLGTGIAVNAFGFADTVWQQAVAEQAAKLQHTSNLYYTAPQAMLAQALAEKSGMKKVFFCNSGAEANECAIKTARKYSSDKYGPGRSRIVTLKDSFHGRTIATLAATGQDRFHKDFGPFPDGFSHITPGNFAELTAAAEDPSVCAFMIELVQGEGGVNVLERDYVEAMAALAKEKDLLLMVDEVQTGNGRCGSMYCFTQYGISPDVVSTAKGLGGGFPIGAVLFGEKTAGVLGFGDHATTFGGNPICAAGALSIVSRIDEALLQSVREKGTYIMQTLSGAPGVKSVSGLGLMVGVETEKPVGKVVARCMEKGVLVLTAHEKVRLLPALNIPFEDLQKAIEILKEVLAA